MFRVRQVDAYSNARVKSYPSIDVVQVCNEPIFREPGWEPLRRLYDVPPKGEGNDPQRAAEVSRNRAKAAVRDIARCNRFDFFFTWTLDAAKISRYDPEEVLKKVMTFLKNASYRKGFRYVLVPELHKDGAIHFHGLCCLGDVCIQQATDPHTGRPLSTERGQPISNIREQPREAFTLEETCYILNFAMAYENRRTGLAVMVLLLTGIRRGELLGLKDADLTDTTLTVNRAVYLEHNRACVTEHEAKTEHSLRTVPLLPELAYMLRHFPHKGEFIFGTKNGTLLHPRNFSRDYDKFFRDLREAEPSVRRLSPHCCRHTFATLTREAGADIRVIQELLGHTNITTTAKYSHANLGSMTVAVKALNGAIAEQNRQLLH